MSVFEWTEDRATAAIMLAKGHTKAEIAAEIGVSDRTIYNWQAETEFAAEVDRLSLMVGIASRAERLRIAQRIVRQKTTEAGELQTEKDLLEWLKFAQGETDGVKLDLAKVASALGGDATPVAEERSRKPDAAARRPADGNGMDTE